MATKRERVTRILNTTLFFLLVLAWTVFTPKIKNLFGKKPNVQNDILLTMSTEKYLRKRIAMQNVFTRYNSPFVEEVDSFLLACIKFDMDCYLLPSISGVESGFGRAYWPGSYNPFGWGGGYIVFDSWSDAILTVASKMKVNYIDRGLTNPDLIGPVYAPPSTTWARNVRFFMGVFEREEKKVVLRVLRL